jgi:hypothetical protein
VTGGLRTGEKGFLRSLRQRCELRRFLIVFPSIGLMLNEKPHYAQKRDKHLNDGRYRKTYGLGRRWSFVF